MAEAALDVREVTSGYGRTPVLHGMSLTVAKGENLGLIGPNGHGKTTFFRAISGLIPVWSGTVHYFGEDITNLSPAKIVERGLIHVPQGNTLFPSLTVLENLWLGSYARRGRPVRKQTIEQVFALFPRLAERRKQKCRTLSGGERQMVSIGCGLMGLPKVLVLDEPTLGLSPKLKGQLSDAIAAIAASGVQTIIVEQDPEFLQALTSRLVFVSEGRVHDEFAESGALEYDRIMEMYFGVA